MTMGFELERVLYETEDFLRRNLGSRSRREAKKRKLRRKFEEWMRRVRRAAVIFAGLLVALIAFSLFIDPIGFFTWLVALPTAAFIAFLSLRSEEHTSELQSLMRISYAVFCLKKKKKRT